jgi:hypothetical protein
MDGVDCFRPIAIKKFFILNFDRLIIMRGIHMKLQLATLAAVGMLAPAAFATPTYPSLPNGDPLGFYLFQGQSSSNDPVTSGTTSASLSGTSVFGSLTVASSNVYVDSTANENLQLGGTNDIINNGSTPATINFYVTYTGFVTPPAGKYGTITVNPLSASLSFAQPGQGGSLTFTQYADPTATAFGMTDPSSTQTLSLVATSAVNTVSGSTGEINFTPSANYPTQPYSVTEEFTVTLDPSSTATLTFLNSTVTGTNPSPEPASIGLLGVAGAGALLMARRRKA